jgi:hypothetical protein
METEPLHIQDREPPSEQSEDEGKLQRLNQLLYKYKVALISLCLVIVGFGCLSFSVHLNQSSTLYHLIRDLGIALLMTGAIGVVSDIYFRKAFLNEVFEIVRSLEHHIFGTQQRIITAFQPTNTSLGSLSAEIKKQLDEFKVAQDAKLKAVQDCISIGDDLRLLGLQRVHQDRTQIGLHTLLHSAAPGSEIRMLGIIISELGSPDIQLLIERKLLEGCQIKILCLDPQSPFVDERIREEERTLVSTKKTISSANEANKNFIDGLQEKLVATKSKGQIELHSYDMMPRYFIFTDGRTMMVGFYLGKTRGAHAPHFQLEVRADGTGISSAFLEHFDWLWEQKEREQAREGDHNARLPNM